MNSVMNSVIVLASGDAKPSRPALTAEPYFLENEEEKTTGIVAEFVNRCLPIIKSLYAPDTVILFGSAARGKVSEESDIDIIIVSKVFEGTRFIKRMGEVVRHHIAS